MSHEQIQANKNRVIELRTIHPEMTLKAIGNEVALTKERVRQILVKEGLPTVSTGQLSTKSKPIEPCKQCGSIDKKVKTKHASYCSITCQQKGKTETWTRWRNNHPERLTTFRCNYCDKEKTMNTSQYRRNFETYKHMYCSYYCAMKAQWDDANSKMSNRRSANGPNAQLMMLPLEYDSTIPINTNFIN